MLFQTLDTSDRSLARHERMHSAGGAVLRGLLDHLMGGLRKMVPGGSRQRSGPPAGWQLPAASAVVVISEVIFGASPAWQPANYLGKPPEGGQPGETLNPFEGMSPFDDLDKGMPGLYSTALPCEAKVHQVQLLLGECLICTMYGGIQK